MTAQPAHKIQFEQKGIGAVLAHNRLVHLVTYAPRCLP